MLVLPALRKHTTEITRHGFVRRRSFDFFIFLTCWGVCVSPLHKGLVNVVAQQRKPREVFMKKKATQPQEGQYQNELTIIEPMKVRLSKKGIPSWSA
jgi:hypothetical protein